jgi:hypothetical protein
MRCLFGHNLHEPQPRSDHLQDMPPFIEVRFLGSETPSDWSGKDNGGLIDQRQRMVTTQFRKEDDRNGHAKCRSSELMICWRLPTMYYVQQWRRVLELPVAEVAT